jgi:hypothetical protein
MGDLVRFPNTKGSRTAANMLGAARIHRLRTALGVQPSPTLSPTDQKTVAEALYKLLQEIEREHGVKKAQVMREAGLGGDGDSTKHLSRYAIKPDGNRARLRKRTGGYEKIAKAAAKLSARDESEVLVEVFGQASFWQKTGTREPEPEFEELADRLRYIMDAVARKHDLTAFFQDVKKGGGVAVASSHCWRKEMELGRPLAPHEIDMEFHFGDYYGGPQIWPIEFDQPTYEAEDANGEHVPVYPSLVLGAWRFDPFRVIVSAQLNDPDGSVRPITGPVEGRSMIQLRLCIVPTGKNLEATPALRVQWTVELSSLRTDAVASPAEGGAGPADPSSCHATRILTFPWWSMPPLKQGRSNTFGRSGSDILDCEAVVDTDTIPIQLGEYFREDYSDLSETAAVAAGVRFLPIYGKVCEDWFGLQTSKNQYDPMKERLAYRKQGIAEWPISESPSAEFSFDVLADALHRCLCDPSNGLDKQFERQAESLKCTYDERLRIAREERADGWKQVKERWEPFSPSADD